MSRKPHEPSEAQRQLVALHAAIGTPQADVARVLDIDEKTLRKHYRDELDLGMTKANARVGKALFDKAISGDTTALIWWTKTRMGWSDKVEVNHHGDFAHSLKIQWGD